MRWLGLYAVLCYLFLYLPLAVLAAFSVNGSRFAAWEGFSLRWYQALAADPRLLECAANSLLIALLATALATIAGTLGAYSLWKRRRAWLTTSLYLSPLSPEVVTGISLLALYQWVFRFLEWPLGMHTVVLAHVSFCLAYVVVVVLSRLRTMDRSLEEAALDLGATEWRAFWTVTLPQLWPGVGAAALLAFTISFDDYVITSLVAGVDSETLPMLIYSAARRGSSPVLNAISTLIALGLGALILLSERLREA
jgi:spermidine/putrescine transport system permease protein